MYGMREMRESLSGTAYRERRYDGFYARMRIMHTLSELRSGVSLRSDSSRRKYRKGPCVHGEDDQKERRKRITAGILLLLRNLSLELRDRIRSQHLDPVFHSDTVERAFEFLVLGIFGVDIHEEIILPERLAVGA